MSIFVSCSENETLTLGEKLGKLLEPGDFVALCGELGSGKTRFAQGVARGLGVDPDIRVTSPTYTILNEYHGKCPLYHFDLYRLAGDSDIFDLGFAEFFYGKGVCLVEWAERLVDELPGECLMISFAHTDDETRRIVFDAHGKRYEEMIQCLFPGE